MNISETIYDHIQDYIDNKGYKLKARFFNKIDEDIISISENEESWAESPLVIYSLTDHIVIDIIQQGLTSCNQKISLLDEYIIKKVEATIDLLAENLESYHDNKKVNKCKNS